MVLAAGSEWGPCAKFWKGFLKALSSRCAVGVSFRHLCRPKTPSDPVPHLVDALKESFVVSPQGFES